MSRSLSWGVNRYRQISGESWGSLPTAYSTGTVTVSASVTVTGSGTAWTTNAKAGWTFHVSGGEYYHILSVNSDTSITLTKAYAGTPGAGVSYNITGGSTTNATIVDNLNSAQWELVNLIKQYDENYFSTTGNISYLSGTDSYALPTTNGVVKTIIDVYRTDLSEKKQLHYIDYRERFKYQNAAVSGLNTDEQYEYWSLNGSNIVITPIPTTTATNNITIDYIPIVSEAATDAATFSIKDDDMDCLIYTAASKTSSDAKITEERDRLRSVLLATVSPRQLQEPRYIIYCDED